MLTMQEWSTLMNVCSAYLERPCNADTQAAIVALRDKCEKHRDATSHDESDAPPHGFTRYQVEIDIHDDVDPSTLLEEAQSLAAELNPYSDDDESAELNELIDNRVSIQRMEG